MRLVITGASGFIGKQIVPIFQSEKVELLLVGRDVEKLTKAFPGCDVCDYETLAEKGQGADALLHLAVLNNDQKGTDEDFHKANVELLKYVIEACRTARIRRLIYTSTFHVETADTPYGKSKTKADALLDEVDDLTLVRLRLPAVYGDKTYQGKLAIVKKVPGSFRNFALQCLRALKPTLHVKRLAAAILEHLDAKRPVDEMLSDRQEGNYVYAFLKKVMDIGFALSVLVFFWWLLIGIWLAVKLTSKGPGIFAQERVGQFGKTFTCYKFRTMAVGTKQAGTHEVSSASVTKIGHFLRKSKIDELPQIFNILKGEVSLVGPRPCLPVQRELIKARDTVGVLDVLPGITGYAQVRNIDMSSAARLASVDRKYLVLRSTISDLVILSSTVSTKILDDKVL